MKTWMLPIAFAALTGGALAAKEAGAPQPSEAMAVDLYMHSNNAMWRPVSQAKRVVSEIFAEIGVNLV